MNKRDKLILDKIDQLKLEKQQMIQNDRKYAIYAGVAIFLMVSYVMAKSILSQALPHLVK